MKKIDSAALYTLRKDGRYQGSYTDDKGRHYVYDRDPEKAAYWQNRYNQTIDEQRKNGSRSVEPPLPLPND